MHYKQEALFLRMDKICFNVWVVFGLGKKMGNHIPKKTSGKMLNSRPWVKIDNSDWRAIITYTQWGGFEER